MSNQQDQDRPDSISDYDPRDNTAWMYSAAAAMVPFTAFCYGHSRGATVRVVEAVVKSPVGVYGLLALPFMTLAMEKSIYDTVQAWQGIDPKIRPKERGGFPSGGAGAFIVLLLLLELGFVLVLSCDKNLIFPSSFCVDLPSLSLIPVQKPVGQPQLFKRYTTEGKM